VVTVHDLLDFGGAFISLTSIHAVIDEIVDDKPTGTVHIHYGSGQLVAFAGDALGVMAVINGYGAVTSS
jgi:hypothetical protein